MIQEFKAVIDNDRYIITENGYKITNDMFRDFLIHSFKFRCFFIDLLKECKYESYFFECARFIDEQQFNFVLLNCTTDFNADGSPFKEYFTDSNVVTFKNINGDTTLIVPTHSDLHNNHYKNLASFVRNIDEDIIHELLIKVGQNLKNGKYLSTNGLGVYWLHVRICDTPKYYH